jgi:hypothetical protein
MFDFFLLTSNLLDIYFRFIGSSKIWKVQYNLKWAFQISEDPILLFQKKKQVTLHKARHF